MGTTTSQFLFNFNIRLIRRTRRSSTTQQGVGTLLFLSYSYCDLNQPNLKGECAPHDITPNFKYNMYEIIMNGMNLFV